METNVNEQEYEVTVSRRERMLTRVMKGLAIVGTITLLALIAYVAVSAFQSVPKFASRVGTGLEAGVVSVTSVLTNEDGEQVVDTTGQSELVIVPTSEDTTGGAQTATDPTCEMIANPTSITQGANATLSWTSANAKSATLDQNIGTVSVLGFRTVTPKETILYTGSFVGINGKIATCNVRVTVTAPTSSPVKKPVTTATTAPAPAPRPTAPAPAPTPVVTRVPADRGPADLAVEISATGILKKVNGKETFIKKDEIASDEVGAVRFVITNMGSKVSDTYTFTVQVPTKSGDEYTYTSKTQKALAGGAKIEYTLGFDDVPKSGTGTITVEVETDDDAKTSNNDDSASVKFVK